MARISEHIRLLHTDFALQNPFELTFVSLSFSVGNIAILQSYIISKKRHIYFFLLFKKLFIYLFILPF